MEQAIKKAIIGWYHGIGVLRAIALAVASVHERGIIHRNLDLSNVLIAIDDTPKLIGFGRAGRFDAIRKSGVFSPTAIDVTALQGILRSLCSALNQVIPDRLAAALATDTPPPSAVAFAEMLERYVDAEREQSRRGLFARLAAWLRLR